MTTDELDQALEAFDEARTTKLDKLREVTTARGIFRQEFMQACHREWVKAAEDVGRRAGNHNHRVEVQLNQEPHQEMMLIRLIPNLKDMGPSIYRDFVFQVKVFPNEAMLRVCVVTVTPDQPEYLGTPETYKMEDMNADNFKKVLSRHLAFIIKSATPK